MEVFAQEQMEQRMLAGIPDSQQEHLMVSEKGNTVQWKEEGQEFYCNGDLYDLISVENVAGGKVYHCIKDADENRIVHALTALCTHNPQKGNPGHNTIIKLLQEIFSLCYIPASEHLIAARFCFIRTYSSLAIRLHPGRYPDIHIPPPESGC